MTIECRDKGFMDTGDGHTVAWYAYGIAEGKPVVSLHGGPGSGVNHGQVARLSGILDKVNWITFDQRGAGQSTPAGSMVNNTTQLLLRDMEQLRCHLGIEKWYVRGASWGTSLAFLYAQSYPERCSGLLLSSLFLARRVDQEWTFSGARSYFADVFASVEQELGISAGASLEKAFLKGLYSAREEEQLQAAYAFSYFGHMMCRLQPSGVSRDAITMVDVYAARILLGYAAKDFFIDPDLGVLQNIQALKNIPIILVHGRYDMDCKISQAFLLKEMLPQLDLRVVAGNHNPNEEPMHSSVLQMLSDTLL